MEPIKKTGLDYDLLVHQFCYQYSTQIAPEINEMVKSFSTRFYIETTPYIQEEYPKVYSQIIVRPLFESSTIKVEMTIFPNPEREVIEIQVKNVNKEFYLAHYAKIDISEWGHTDFTNLFLNELYLAFFKKTNGSFASLH